MAAPGAATIVVPAPLEGPFNTAPSPEGLQPAPSTTRLVQTQVEALLNSTPSFHELAEPDRERLTDNLVRVSAYAAECMRDICWQSAKLGQTPVVRKRETLSGPIARAQTSNFDASAAKQIGKVTSETLKAIAFPRFVADLIRSTFNAIVQTSIQQMEAFGKLLENVTKTVDDFMQENISDNQARDWLQQRYPDHIQVQDGKAVPKDGGEEKPLPNFQGDLKLSAGVSLDESSIEETLVPAARRRLAESRLQLLSTLVLMGVNRIVITGGKIRATMGFHIDTRDRAHEEHATDLDTRVAAAGSYGFGPWSVSASMSFAYVSSTRASSDSEINTETDLTGEVELHFKSDYFPVERFAPKGTLATIQNNTAVPEANAPNAAAAPFSAPPALGGDVPTFSSPRTKRTPLPEPSLRPIGAPLPDVKKPVQPDEPDVKRHVDAPDASETKKDQEKPDSDKPTDKKDAKPEGEDGAKKAAPDAGKKEKAGAGKKGAPPKKDEKPPEKPADSPVAEVSAWSPRV